MSVKSRKASQLYRVKFTGEPRPPDELIMFSGERWGRSSRIGPVGSADLMARVEGWLNARSVWKRLHGDQWPVEVNATAGNLLFAQVIHSMRHWARTGQHAGGPSKEPPDETRLAQWMAEFDARPDADEYWLRNKGKRWHT